jgi:hypothetical protein
MLTTRDKSGSRRSTNPLDYKTLAALRGVLIAALLAFIFVAHARPAETITWAPYKASILRIDDSPPKVWNIYRDTRAKSDDILLLEWGTRYLRLNTKAKEVREMDPQLFTHKNDKLTSSADDVPGKILPTAGWVVRNVGSAARVYFELTEENHKVDINLPYGGR